MSGPYSLILHFLVLVFFVLAFLSAGWKGKLILVGIFVVVFGLPYLVHPGRWAWVFVAAKALFGVGCYLFIRRAGFL